MSAATLVCLVRAAKSRTAKATPTAKSVARDLAESSGANAWPGRHFDRPVEEKRCSRQQVAAEDQLRLLALPRIEGADLVCHGVPVGQAQQAKTRREEHNENKASAEPPGLMACGPQCETS
jgi:hypothetical protein